MGAIVSPVTNERPSILQWFACPRKPLSAGHQQRRPNENTGRLAATKKPRPVPGLRLTEGSVVPRSILRDDRTAEPVIDAGAQDVVGKLGAHVCTNRACRCKSERS